MISATKMRILSAVIFFGLILNLGAADPPPELPGVADPAYFKRYEGSRLFRFQVIVQLNTVRAGGMDEKMVVVNADQMESSIKSAGRVAIYGILFDFNKADVKAESAEMAKLLKSKPGLKLLVAGHTDKRGRV